MHVGSPEQPRVCCTVATSTGEYKLAEGQNDAMVWDGADLDEQYVPTW